MKLFSSPIGESTFSTCQTGTSVKMQHIVFVPYRGIYFLYDLLHFSDNFSFIVFVPYRGIYFLYLYKFFRYCSRTRFRPLSGNLLSLPTYTLGVSNEYYEAFSSPIGESTFSTKIRTPELYPVFIVFVPYRGIYFLY